MAFVSVPKDLTDAITMSASLPRLFNCSSDNWIMTSTSCIDKTIIPEQEGKGQFMKMEER